MKKYLLHFSIVNFIIFLSSTGFAQQNGIIKGRVSTSDGKPATGISLGLTGTSNGALSKDDGSYQISRVKPGNYTLSASAIGLSPQQQNISIAAGQTLTIDFVLNENAQQLQEVVIRSGNLKFGNKKSEYVARMPLANLENPQAYAIATKELIKDQDITDFASAIRAIPGAATATTTPYQFSGFYLRGFNTSFNLRNGLFTYGLGGGDPQDIERLEAIKGPSGTLFGTATSYGGVLNKVTKKPFDTTAIEAGINVGSYGFKRITADVNTPLNADRSVLLRVNTAYHTEGSFQDYGTYSSFLFAPSLLYKVNDRLNIQLDAEINTNNALSAFYFRGPGQSGVKSIDKLGLDYYKSYTSNDLTFKPTIQNFFSGQVNYTFNDKWKFSGNISSSDVESHSGVIDPTFISSTKFIREVYDFDFEWHVLDIQPNLTGEFNIGKVKNRVLFGLDYQNYINKPVTGGYTNADTVDLTKPVPVINVALVRQNFSRFSYGSSSDTYAAYASDVISFTDRLNLLLSLRFDHYRFNGDHDYYADIIDAAAYSQNSLSPKIGATYQLIKNNLSVFANYLQAFQNVAPSMTGQVFRPEHAYQLEAGLKIDLLDGKLSSTISYYDIQVKDKVRQLTPTESIQNGTQVSKGVDADLIANPLPGLNIVAGYAYNHSRIVNADVNQGNRPGGVPNNSANLWASYVLQQGAIKGFGAGFGMNYVSQVFYNDNNDFTIPEFTTLKGSLFYNQPKYRLSITANNLSDKRYWNNVGTPQMPRQILGTLSVKF